MIKAETLASISEYGEDSRVETCSTRASSIVGLSSATGSVYGGTGYVTRSQSGDSINTLTTLTNRSYKNGERKQLNSESTQRLRGKAMAQKKQYDFCKKVRVTVALIGILLLVAAIFMLSFYLPKQYSKRETAGLVPQPRTKPLVWDDNLLIKDNMQIHFSTNFSGPETESEWRPDIALKGYFGETLSVESKKQVIRQMSNKSLSMRFNDTGTTLEISKMDFDDRCYHVAWRASFHVVLEDCFDTQSAHWFGLGENYNQHWPLNKGSFGMTKFVTNDYLTSNTDSTTSTKQQVNTFGPVIEPLAVNSNGAGIYVPESISSLYISMNDKANGAKKSEKKFCLQTRGGNCDAGGDLNRKSYNELNYTICIAEDIREVHRILFNEYIKVPTEVPDKRMIEKPIWCTWAKFKKEINQSVILKYAEDIIANKFDVSHLVIDDQYSTKYGDLNFDSKKFNDVSNMINRLRSDGFRTIVTVTLFTNLDSNLFKKTTVDSPKGKPVDPYDRWLKVGFPGKSEAGIVTWWNGRGVVLDTTNPEAMEWFQDHLKTFQKLKIDGFKFDGGEFTSLPPHHMYHMPQINPSRYSYNYVKLASQFPLAEVRTGYKSQSFPLFVRLLDRASMWSQQGGLRSVLNAALTLSIIGYPYILPDMVGGNNYVNDLNKELYVRWAQLCAFLPAIQFSIPPWDFDEEVVQLVHEALDIRRSLSSYILDVATNVTITGEPILRPLWWYWPKVSETYVIDYEFMLGETYLIAPILNANIIKHAVYLPPGHWVEQWGTTPKTINSTGGIYHYSADLHTICYFKLIQFSPGE